MSGLRGWWPVVGGAQGTCWATAAHVQLLPRPLRSIRQVSIAARRDLELLAQALPQGGWEGLAAEEQQQLRQLYSQHGLELAELLEQAHKQVRLWSGALHAGRARFGRCSQPNGLHTARRRRCQCALQVKRGWKLERLLDLRVPWADVQLEEQVRGLGSRRASAAVQK